MIIYLNHFTNSTITAIKANAFNKSKTIIHLSHYNAFIKYFIDFWALFKFDFVSFTLLSILSNCYICECNY